MNIKLQRQIYSFFRGNGGLPQSNRCVMIEVVSMEMIHFKTWVIKNRKRSYQKRTKNKNKIQF
jgi:hypothetical protein